MIKINKAGCPYLLASLMLILILVFLNLEILSLIAFILLVFLVIFFRDPERKIPREENIIVAPADGRVKYIEKVSYSNELDGPAKVVHIFLYPWSVHINRAPISGRITSIESVKGKHRPAFMKSSTLNHQNKIKIFFEGGTLVVSQVVGFLARRIKCWVRSGQYLSMGDKIGMILFGSGVTLIMPPNVKIKVKIGEKVRAGETIIAKW